MLDLDDIVQRVIRGEFGNVEPRWQALTELGYDWKVVQNKVNEVLGCSYRYAVDSAEANDDLADSQENLNKVQAETIEQIMSMSHAQLLALGLTHDEVKQLRKLSEYAEMAGLSLEEVVNNPELLSGRSLITNSFKNFGNAIIQVCGAIKSAFTSMFPSATAESIALAIFKMVAALHKFSLKFKGLDSGSESIKNLRDTFKGLFAILDIVLTIVGGPLKFAFKTLMQVLGMFDLNILEVTGAVGRAIVKFHDWIEEHNIFATIIKSICDGIQSLITNFNDWYDTVKDSENLPRAIAEGIVNCISYAIDAIKNFFSNIGENIKSGFKSLPTDGVTEFANKLWNGVKLVGAVLEELGRILLGKLNEFLTAHGYEEIPEYMISGLANGIRERIGTALSAIADLAAQLVAKIEEILGIESPSKVFFAIGGFIVAGLIAGLLAGSPEIKETMTTIGSKIIEFFGNVDWGTVIASISAFVMSLSGLKLASAFSNFSEAAEGVGSVLFGVGKILSKSARGIGKILISVSKLIKSFAKVMNSIAFEHNTKGVKNLAISLLILVGAIAILTLIDPDKLWDAVSILGALALILVGLSAAMGIMSKASLSITKDGLNMNGIHSSLKSMALALLLLAVTVKMIGSMDPDEAKRGFKGLVGLVLAVIAVIAAFGLLVKGKAAMNIGHLGKTLRSLGVAMLLLAIVAKIIAGMSWEGMLKAAIGIKFFTGMVITLIAVSMFAGKNVGKVGGTVLKIAIAMGVLVLVAKMIAGMTWEDMGKAGVGLLGLAGIVTILISVTKLAGPNIGKIGSTILGISLAMGVLVLVAKMIAGMTWEDMGKAGVGLLALTGIIALLMRSVKMVGDSAPKIALTLLAMSVSIGILAGVAILLGLIKIEYLAKGLIAVGMLASFMALMIYASRGASDCKNNLIVMTVAIALMAGAIAALTLIKDTKKLVVATLALTMLMGIFAIMIAATKLAKNTKSMRKTLIDMLGVVIALTILVAALSLVDSKNVLPNVEALSILLLSFSASMAVLGSVSRVSKTAKNALLPMLGVVLGLAIILGGLAAFKVEASIYSAIALGVLLNAMAAAIVILSHVKEINPLVVRSMALLGLVVGELAIILGIMNGLGVEASITTVAAISILLAAMTGVFIVLGMFGALAPMANAGIGSMALLGLVVGELAVILGLMDYFDVQPSIETATSLSILLTTMSKCLIALSVVGLLGPAAFVGIGALATMIAGIGGLIVAIGALVTEFPKIEEFLNAGIPVLEQIGYAIGSFFGNIIGGFLGNLTSGLPEIATDLSNFMINLMPFIAGAKLIDVSVLEGIGVLSAAIIALTVADFVEGVSSFLQGGSNFAELGMQLSQFMINALPFIIMASTITPEMLSGVNALADTILILTAADILQGLTSFITGGSSLESFASQLPLLGDGLSAFSESLGTFTEEQLATVNCAAEAIKTLASAASEIPNAGGLLADLVGDNELGTFAEQFPTLGTGLRGFLDNVGTFTEEQVETVNCAAESIKSLAEAASTIPNEGGWIAKIIGDNNLGLFAEQFPSLGSGIRGFLDNAGVLDDSSVSTIKAGADAVKSLASVSSEIPNSGGALGWIVGNNDLGTFAEQFPALGTGLSGFVNNIGTFTMVQVATVGAAASAISSLAGLANADLKNATNYLSDFGEDLPDFATNLASYCSNMPGTASVANAVSNLRILLDGINDVADTNTGALSEFSDNLESVGEDSVDKFVSAFTSSSAKTDVEEAATTLAGKAVDGAGTQEDEMESAGKDLGDGLVAGINAKQTAAYNAGYALGRKAVQGEKDGQQSKSPSKLTIKAGKWLGEGLVIGIRQMGDKVYSAGSSLGSDATKSISSAISNISNLVSGDLDVQPTIRPVLDLSDVRSGANSISSLLGAGSSISLMSDVKSIGSAMNARGQNGANSDIVSAIDSLRKDIGKVGGTSYNINGITYDDGSNVSDAVKVLVRAAKIGKRV